MTVTTLHREVVHPAVAEGWNRAPDFERARRIRKLKRRRADIVRSARQNSQPQDHRRR